LIELAVVFVPSAGEVIATTGTEPRLTVTVAGVLVPNSLEQETVIVLAPVLRATLLVVALEVAVPFTVQVVPPGIEAEPLTVNAVLIEALVVFVLLAGDVIATDGV
jgi:hypothetical protein